MRVTNNMLTNTFIANISNNLKEMERVQTQLSTGRRFNKPSEDPVGTINSLRLRSSREAIRQYTENIKESIDWLESTDVALDNVSKILQRARELAVTGSSDTQSQESRNALAAEVDQLITSLIDVANTTHDGRYIFGGYKTINPPFALVAGPPDSVTYSGDQRKMRREIGENITVDVNLTGDEVFKVNMTVGPPYVSDLFGNLIALRDHLKNPAQYSLITFDIGNIDSDFQNISDKRAQVGAKINRLELANSRLGDLDANTLKLLSENDDADLAKTVMELQNKENIYKASLAAGARIIPPTLMDFLK